MNIDPNTGIWLDEDRHRIYDQTLAQSLVEFCRNKQFSTVVDLGCGAGFYVQHLKDGGLDCTGYDGNPHTPEITHNVCGVLDLSKPIGIGTYACVISLEVGEHIPATFQEIYINNILSAARDYVILSWARPGQGGLGHYNERPQSEIVERIECDGVWKLDPLTTMTLRQSSSLPWFQNTILCFSRVQRAAEVSVVTSADCEYQQIVKQPNCVFDNARQVRDDLFRRRIQSAPHSITLDFWQRHFCAKDALESPELHGQILDFGCGTGEIDVWLARAGQNVIGFDFSPVALDVAEKHRSTESDAVKGRLRFVLGNNGSLPFPDHSFDAIFCNHGLENIAHLTPILKELARVLKPNGALVTLVSQGTAYYDKARAHLFDAETLEETLATYFASVTVETQTDHQQFKAVCRNTNAVTFPRIVCMLRIRNEERWIKEVLDSIARVADGIVIVDDGSTDHTPLICKFHPAVVDYHWQNEPETDQRRDKQLALQMALAQQPDWIMGLDADEPLEQSAAPRIYEAIRKCPDDVAILKIESLFMWNDLRHYRADGPYERICQERLFRVKGQNPATLEYQPTKFRGNGHCTRLPGGIVGKELEIDVKILHLGYMYPDVRARRYEYYRQRDPKEFANGDYAHLIDQPGQIIKEWQERPFRNKSSKTPTMMSHPNSTMAKLPAQVKQEHKPDYYYANARRDLIAHVPLAAKRILDVGCGHGLTGGLLRSERQCYVAGIEIHAETARVASEHLDDVYVGDLEAMELPFAPHSFDCILLGDVLEHLIDPWKAVAKLKNLLSPNGVFVASLPNVRNLAVMKALIEGSWTYEEYGILDKTHLRFFTIKEMQSLFIDAGLECECVETVCDPLFRAQMEHPSPETQTIEDQRFMLKNVSPEELRELTAIQFYFVAKQKITALQTPKASVIIPVFNNLGYTRKCITSLFAVPETTSFEVIVVNNGSTDGTTEYLDALGSAIRPLHLPQNLGFAKGCNRGAEIAQGGIVVFLNNDTEVLPNWLDELVDCLEHNPDIGLVGNLQIFPDSQRVQQCGIVCGPHAMVYSLYNNLLPATHPAVNKPRDFQFIAGSCMALRRAEFAALGGFDEGYLNSCEDIDLCLRVRETGQRVHYCPTSKIYHYESKTATGHDKAGPNYQRLLARWRDKMPQDDFRYLAEDGFAYDPRTNTLTPIPLVKEESTLNKNVQTPLPSAPRVAILTTYHQRCGLAAYAEFMVKALRENGVVPLILAERTTDTLCRDDDDVIRCWTRDADGGQDLLAVVQKHGINVLHVNYGGYFALDGWLEDTLRALRKHGVRVIITFHMTESSSPKFGALARQADICYVHHAQNILELVALGAPPDRLEQIPLGMPPLTRADIFESKLALNWNPAEKVVATFGFVEPHKGILEVIEAIHAVNQSQRVQLLVIGGANANNPESAPYLQTCKNRIQDLQLTGLVHFTEEYVPDEAVKNYLRASDVLVMNYQSHRYEASQSTAIALSTGRPVITTASPVFELPQAVTLKTTNYFPLPVAIIYLLNNPFVGRVLLNNVMTYEKTAGWPVIAQRLAESYQRVYNDPPKEDIDFPYFYATHPDEIYADGLQRERLRWLKSKAKGRILEIGPANGYVAEFTGAEAAVDIYRGRLHVAAALRPETSFHYGNILDGLPFKDQEFDQVLAPEIFEHVDFDDAVRALKECLRVGRSVLVTMPCADKPDYDPVLVHNVEHRWMVNRGTVQDLLRQAGCGNYTIDTSQNNDFYLLEIGNATAAVITPRAAALPTMDLSANGETIRVAIDVTCIDHESLQQDDYSRSLTAILPHLLHQRPRWEWILTAANPHSLIRNFATQNQIRFEPWSAVATARPDVVLLTHPFAPELENVILLAKQAQCVIASPLSDVLPAQFPQTYLTPNPEFRTFYLQRMTALLQSCDLFFCQSQQTLQDMQIHMNLPQARMRVIHGAAFPEYASATTEQSHELLSRCGLQPERYVVIPAPYLPHKNIPQAMAAFAQANTLAASKHELVFHDVAAGLRPTLFAMAAEQRLNENDVVFLGELRQGELNALYQQAALLFMPSAYEGFPQALMNGMACGAAVIAGNNSAMAEILSEAQTVPVNDVDALTKTLADVLQDRSLRQNMKHHAQRLSAHYTWQRAAEKTIMYLAEFIGHQRMSQDHHAKSVKRERPLAAI